MRAGVGEGERASGEAEGGRALAATPRPWFGIQNRALATPDHAPVARARFKVVLRPRETSSD